MRASLADQLSQQFGRPVVRDRPPHNKTPSNPSRQAIARVKDPLPAPTVCRHCEGPVTIAPNEHVYGRPFGDWPWVYICLECAAYVGLHPFTAIPLGTLATSPIRAARKRAKTAFNPLWEGEGASMSRDEAYAWLSDALKIKPAICHIAMFDVDDCERVIAAVQARASLPG